MITPEKLAEQAAFLAQTFGDSSPGINGHTNYRLADRHGRMVIRIGTEGFATISLDGQPALYRSPVFGYTQTYNHSDDELAERLGLTGNVVEI